LSAEHGPYGGDEINKIEKNKNYGWPYYTYGTDYGKKSWPLNNKLKLDNYKEPIVSWTPSIAVSNLIFYNSKYLPKWKNNFIVSTLRDKNLYRITLSKNYRRMINVEKIKIDYRMRDIIVDSRGRIIILTDTKNNDVAPKIIILENKKVN
jgi:glucose/arabinose dehydrogenase